MKELLHQLASALQSPQKNVNPRLYSKIFGSEVAASSDTGAFKDRIE